MVVRIALGVVLAAVVLYPRVARWAAVREARQRIDGIAQHLKGGGATLALDADRDVVVSLRAGDVGSVLASWQTVGGCGGGASTGTGAGVKWVGRNVTGGLFHVELQGNYIKVDKGYDYVASLLVNRDLNEKWTLGVSVPFLYKYMRDPFDVGIDLANKGVGDVNLLITRRLGSISATSATLSLGAPTGTSDTLYKMVPLAQDRQMGLGRPTASLVLDHTLDRLWGNTVFGGVVSYRGGENATKSYRAPSATGYGYLSYMLGQFVPAIGLQLSGFPGHDRSHGAQQDTALFSAGGSVSLEWATDWMALLVGAVVPYQYDGVFEDSNGDPKKAWGFGPWIVAVGAAFAPF